MLVLKRFIFIFWGGGVGVGFWGIKRERRSLGKILHGWVWLSRGAGGMVPWETLKTRSLLALISNILQVILCSLLSYVNFYGSWGCKCIHRNYLWPCNMSLVIIALNWKKHLRFSSLLKNWCCLFGWMELSKILHRFIWFHILLQSKGI